MNDCKSQNTKNEQQKDLCITSEQLTEQWKKGELPDSDYFISNGYEIYPDYFDSAEGFLKTYNYGVRRIVAEVPDYVEWQNMVNCACEEHEANKRLLEENAQLKEKIERLEKQYAKAKWWLNEIVNNHRFTPISTAEKALKDLEELENG